MKFLLLLLIISMPLISKEKELIINACGVVRGAFVNKLVKEFSKEYKIKVILNKQGGDRDVISALNTNKANIGVGCRALFNIKSEKELRGEQIKPIDGVSLYRNKSIKKISKRNSF